MHYTRKMVWALSLLLGVSCLSWLGWRAQAARTTAVLPSGAHAYVAAASLATLITVNATADVTLAALAGNGTYDLREAIAAANTNAPTAPLATITVTSTADNATSEVQQITLGGTSGGTVTLNFNGANTAPLTYTTGASPTAAQVQLALNNLSTIGGVGGNVTVTGANGGPFSVTFGGALAGVDVPQITASTTGGTTATIATSTNGVSGCPGPSCTLRGAIAAAAAGDTVNFSVTGTITLTQGELFISKNLTIEGPGANLLTISGNNASRVFFINTGVTASLSGLTITGGNGAGAVNSGLGGGILNQGNLTLTASHVTGNAASLFGGGITNFNSMLTIERSAVTGNSANGSTTSGGIDSVGTLTVTNTTVSGNRASGIAGSNGGGIRSSGTATITGSTITDNEAAGLGSASGVHAFSGTVTVRNTIIAANRNNTATPDVSVNGGTFDSDGYNLIGNPGTVMAFNQTGDQVGTPAAPLNPLLGPLAQNGGPTPTQRPLTGSPAIDKGFSFGLTTDQRGFPRPVDNPAIANTGDGADIGAVEVQANVATLTLTIDPATNPTGAANELISALNQANEDPGATTINLLCGIYTLTGRGDPTNYYGFNGLPVITTPVIIQGNGAVIERNSSAPSFRLFAIANRDATGTPLGTPGSLTLDQVTLRGGLAQGGRGGNSSDDSGGGGGAGLGGAIFNQGTLTIRRSALIANTAQGGAGGNRSGGGGGEGGGGGSLGGNGGDSTNTDGGSGGGGFGGNGGLGSNAGSGGGEGGGQTANGSQGSGTTGGSGGSAEGGDGGNSTAAGSPGGFGGGGGGGGFINNGGAGGIGGGGGGGGAFGSGSTGGFGGGGGGGSDPSNGGLGGFFGGGGGGGTGGVSSFGGGPGGSNNVAGGGGGAGAGGAVFNDQGASVTISNSTFSGNAASGGAGGTGFMGRNGAAGQGLGGGLFNLNGTASLNNVTLANNTAQQGGALYNLGINQGAGAATATLTLNNSILANTLPPGATDCASVMGTGGSVAINGNNNLIENNNACPGVTKTADPQLQPLTMANCAASGCSTPVHTLSNTSPAVNMAGGNAETLDQCGTTRPQGGGADIGAFEVIVTLPTISKAFSPTAIPTGGSSTITLTLTNANAFALTGASFSDMLMGGLSATGGAVAGTCAGTMPTMLTAGQTSLSFTGITIPASSSCTISFAVTSSTTGAVNNQTSGVTSDQNTTAGSPSNMATLTVVLPPVATKSFTPSTIALNGNSTLQVGVTNLNPFLLTGVSITDTLPDGVVIVNPGGPFQVCGGTLTMTATSFALSNISVAPANGSCSVVITVRGTTAGTKVNTTSVPTSSEGGTGTAATATLTVVASPAISKSFSPTTINAGASSQLTLIITNPAGNVALTNLAVTDNLPAGVTVAATPGLTNTCGGTVTGATAGSSSFSLSGGTLGAGASCQVQVNVTSSTPGTVTNTTGAPTATGNGVNVAGTAASAMLTVSPVTSTPIVTIVDPFGCTGPGDVLTVTVAITNPAVIAQPVTFTSTLPAGLVGISGTGTSTVGAPPPVMATGAGFGPTVLAAGQTAAVSYQVQVGDAMSGAQLCINTASTFSGADGPSVQACATLNCPPVGPGLPFPATSEVSDQKAGSVLVYNLYSSSAAAPNSQNTRLSITNTNPALDIAVHLFFVDGQTCSIADATICLTKNQTAGFLASDLDPGTTGYLVAVASDTTTGCPINFNFLIGDAYVKLTSGHHANLGAEAFSALAGGPVECDGNALTAQLNFDGVSYNRAPRTVAASSIPARNDGNDTLLVVNRFGGNLATGASTLTDLLGLFYDDAENALSFTFSPGTCQFRSSLSSNFPRTTPRLETFIPAGRTGWLRLYSTSDIGLLGAVLNYNPNAGTSAGAFNQGRNLHKLTLTGTQTLVIPIFPPNCLD